MLLIGQKWKEVDPRKNRVVRIVGFVYGVGGKIQRVILENASGFRTKANPERFNGKRGGYELVTSFEHNQEFEMARVNAAFATAFREIEKAIACRVCNACRNNFITWLNEKDQEAREKANQFQYREISWAFRFVREMFENDQQTQQPTFSKSPPPPAPPRGLRLYEGTWPVDCIQRAFVAGAKWWQFYHNGATMFSSERHEAEDEAVHRYGEPS